MNSKELQSIFLSNEVLQQAYARVRPHVVRTNLSYHPGYSKLCHSNIFLKLENLQHTGSFKIRGATNKILRTLQSGVKPRGVIAVSAGNHAQGVAWAARQAGLKACVVMPLGASLTKVRACQELGAEVLLGGDGLEAAMVMARQLEKERGYLFLHPYDDWDVIAGQAGVGCEILEDLPTVDTVIVPLGGGGLLSGIALAVKQTNPEVRVIGVQTEAVAPFRNLLRTGQLETVSLAASTIADGIKVKKPGQLTVPLIQQYVDEIITVDDGAIAETIVSLLERTRTIGEGAGVVALAALLKNEIALKATEKIAVVISGGNIDMPLVGRSIDFGLVSSGRLLAVMIRVPDTPGQLAKLLNEVAALGMNVREVEHRRGELHIPVGETEIIMEVETRDWEHQTVLLAWLEQQGYRAKRLAES